ncbi:MAG: GWxTD domain-containing protein [Bacteroidetes bacterium]|nr:GWxTD domain-containing protein [Bacteroidota bacterium]
MKISINIRRLRAPGYPLPVIFLLAIFIYSCASSRVAYNQDMSYMYKREATVLHPDYQVYHTSDVTTDVFFSIASKELLYAKQPNESDYRSRLIISYLLTQSYESKVVIDSGSVRLTDINNDNVQKRINGKFTVKAGGSPVSLLKISLYDQNRNQWSETYIDIYKANPGSSQNFLVKNKDTHSILFRNYTLPGENVVITYRRLAQSKLFVKYFKREFPVAAPPFSIVDPRPFSYKADSTFTLSLSDTGTVIVHLEHQGIYNFVIDTNQREGLTLYRFYDGFPDIVRADQMVNPLRFITSKDEYDNMNNNKNKKASVDAFWINCAGSQDRAKEVIRKYYNRVKDANVYFTSYLEGWKTDRGMVYLIFGPPNLVYKATDSETWVYGEDNNLNSLNFNFNKVTNPIADNDYILQRSTIYKSNWYRSVDIWRQGRIYLQN